MTMTLNGLAKLSEELGELQQVVAKKIAYYNTDTHPDGKGSLKERLEEEIADVRASITFVIETFELDNSKINKRYQSKLNNYRKWHLDRNV